MNYNSVKGKGRDYSAPLVDMLPEIIGKQSKPIKQIAKTAGRSEQSVRIVVERLRKNGIVHIKRWKRGESGPFSAYYFWGAGKDAKRPKPITNAEKVRRYRATEKGIATHKACKTRWLKTEEAQQYRESYNKARWAREKFSKGGLAAIDPLLAAIMGGSARTTEEFV